MNKEQKLVLELIKSTLIGTKVEIGDDYDWHSFLQLCIDGGVCSIIFDAIRELDGFSEEIFNDLKKQAFLNLSYSVKQEHEYQVISAAFENNNIDYLPLKGLVLREYYPKKYYRMMCDMDILINPKQYDITYKTMKEIGYSLEEESDHNIAWSNNGVTVELHKKLYPNFDERFNEYFKSGWQFARCCNGHQYRMSDEDFYISIFVHFVRHFRSGGIGIRQFLDLWVYRKNNPFLDDDYIIRILNEIGLNEFHRHVLDTFDSIFGDKEHDEAVDIIVERLFESKMFGTMEMRLSARSDRDRAKYKTVKFSRVGRVCSILFLPLDVMKKQYSCLNKCPFLLPLFWLVRCFDILLNRRQRISKVLKNIETIDAESADMHRNFLNKVGLSGPAD